MESYFRVVDDGTFMVNCNVGYAFLNFMLEPHLRSHAGINLSSSFLEETIVNIHMDQGCW